MSEQQKPAQQAEIEQKRDRLYDAIIAWDIRSVDDEGQWARVEAATNDLIAAALRHCADAAEQQEKTITSSTPEMKRYRPGAYGAMVEDADGKWIHVDDLTVPTDAEIAKAKADYLVQLHALRQRLHLKIWAKEPNQVFTDAQLTALEWAIAELSQPTAPPAGPPGDGIAQAKEDFISELWSILGPQMPWQTKTFREAIRENVAVDQALDRLIAAVRASVVSLEPIPHESPASAKEQCANIEVHLRNLLNPSELEEAGATITEGRPLHIRVMRVTGYLQDQLAAQAQEIERLKGEIGQLKRHAKADDIAFSSMNHEAVNWQERAEAAEAALFRLLETTEAQEKPITPAPAQEP